MAYDELKINSEKQLSDLNAQLATISHPSSRGIFDHLSKAAATHFLVLPYVFVFSKMVFYVALHLKKQSSSTLAMF